MIKEILKFGENGIKNINFTTIKFLFKKKDVDIDNVLVSDNFYCQKSINTLLVTRMIIKELSHYR